MIAYSCKQCLKKGHSCETTNQVDGEYMCLFCEDGVPCPFVTNAARQKKIEALRPAPAPKVAAVRAQRATAPRKNKTPWGAFGSLGLQSKAKPPIEKRAPKCASAGPAPRQCKKCRGPVEHPAFVCIGCKSKKKIRTCSGCGSQLFDTRRKCNDCRDPKYLQEIKQQAPPSCIKCGNETGRPKAKFCNGCRPAPWTGGGGSARPRKYFPTPVIDAKLRGMYEQRLQVGRYELPSLEVYGNEINWPKWALVKRARELGLCRVKEKPWTDVELTELKKYIGHTDVHISNVLRKKGIMRSASAVHNAIRRYTAGVRALNPFYSATSLSKLMGIDAHAITAWIHKGMLKAELKGTVRTEQQGGDSYNIRPRDVRQFFVDFPAEFDLRKVDQVWFMGLLTAGMNGEGAGWKVNPAAMVGFDIEPASAEVLQ